MSTTSDFDTLARAWLDEGPTHLSDWTLDAALREVHLTRQRRALRVSWRFPTMPALTRATGIAAVALVAVVGAGGIIYLSGGQPTPVPTPTPAPTAAPTPGASWITEWTSYTSEVHGFTLSYPADWTLYAPSTREWRAGDALGPDDVSFAEVFVSPGEGETQVALFVWRMPAIGADLGSWEGLQAWAETFCSEIGAAACGTFADTTTPLCNTDGGRECEAAILVATSDHQFAFFRRWTDAILGIQKVQVVAVAREDSHASVARYGGSVQLLKSILDAMGVTAPRPGQTPD